MKYFLNPIGRYWFVLFLFSFIVNTDSVRAQTITTVAGIGLGASSGDGGPATVAHTDCPALVCFDAAGNYYFGENISSPRVRKVNTANLISSVAGTGISGFSGDGAPATAAKLGYTNIAVDVNGNVYIADYINYRVRRVDATTKVIHTIAGTGFGGYTGDGGPATAATLKPSTLCLDTAGNLYISDSTSIRKVDKAGVITTAVPGFSGFGLCFDKFGKLHVGLSTRIAKVDLVTGKIDTIAGTGLAFYSGDEIPATAAQFQCIGMAFDPFGDLYISDNSNNRIRKIDAGGIIHTVAGTGVIGFSGDGSVATAAQLYHPYGVAFDECGNLYIADMHNYRIRKINYPSPPSSVTIMISPNDTVCAGTSVTFTASVTGGGYTPGYKWYVNGTLVSTAGSTYSYTPAHKDSIRCVLTSSCSGLPTYSNRIHMVVNPVVTTSISIAVSPDDTLCVGTPATYTATSTGGGASPAYQWNVNGMPVGSGSTTYSYTPANGDVVFCVLTSSAICPTTLAKSSNSISMVVDTHVTPYISLSGVSAMPVGVPVTITATVTGTGSSSYMIHWLNHGIEFATTAIPSVTYTKPAGLDTITARVVVTSGCHDSAIAEQHTVTNAVLVTPIYSSVSPQWRVYPNPVGDVVFVEGLQGVVGYRLLSIVGVVMQEGELSDVNNSISVKDLPKGAYLLEVSREGERMVRRVVKE